MKYGLPTSPLAIDTVPNTTAQMCLVREAGSKRSALEEKRVLCFSVSSRVISHLILTSFCAEGGKV